MNIWFTQVYIEGGVEFPFSHHFQRRLSNDISALVNASTKFICEYGEDYNLSFYISAKRGLQENEICGPSVFKKTKDVEYTIFLPFDVITTHGDAPRIALHYLLDGVSVVFDMLEIDKMRFIEKRESIIEDICADPMMLAEPHWSGVSDKTWMLFKSFFTKSRPVY